MGAGQSSGAQDQVLPGLLPADTFEAQRDPAAVAPDQIAVLARRAATRPDD